MDTENNEFSIRRANSIRDWSSEQGKIIVTIPVPDENMHYQFAFTRKELEDIVRGMQNFLDSNQNI